MPDKKATLIYEDGDSINIEPENGTHFSLLELYGHLKCDIIQLLILKTGEYMIVDEEGKLKKDPILNKIATTLYGNHADYVVGRAIVCHKSMFK